MRTSRVALATLIIAATVGAWFASHSAVATRTAAPVPSAALPTYASKTGFAPPPGACGTPDLAAVAAAQTEVVAVGSRMIRCDLNWWTVQPHNAYTFDWSIYDNVVNAAAYLGIQVLFTPQFTPPWARPAVLPAKTVDPSHVPPVKMADYVAFVHEAAQRYTPTGQRRPANVGGSVSLWEIWNEPNNYGFWNPVDPVRYSNFLIASYYAIKWVDPNSKVIAGGLAPAGNVNGNIAPDTFTYVMGLTGALSLVDAVAVHPYTFWAYPSEKINWNPLVNHVPRMYNVMKNFGAGSKKIWATEAGWPTSSKSVTTLRPDGSQVGTETVQALALYDLLVTWNRYPYSGPMFIYAQRDKCTNLTSWFCMMGIDRVDGTHKPSYNVIKNMMKMPIM